MIEQQGAFLSFEIDLNIGIELKLVRLVLNQHRQKIVEHYSKRICNWAFPEKKKQRFLCYLTKATKI